MFFHLFPRLRHLAVAVVGLAAGASAAPAASYDLVVYGGTPAGLAAGITAAREGASVVVIEPTKWIGGMVTGGLSSTDLGKQECIGGFPREYFKRAAAIKSETPLWYAEPQANMAAFQAMLKEAGVKVVTEQSLKALEKKSGRITSLTTADGQVYQGRVFVDATYEGDLLAASGVSHTLGRESKAQYGEPLAGIHPMPVRPHGADVMGVACKCVGGTGPHYIHGTPCKINARGDDGKLLFGVTELKGKPGDADKLTQAYNFRVCVTQRPDIRVPFPKPEGYEPARYELLLRLIQSYSEVAFGRLVHLGQIGHGKVDLNAQGFFSTDYPGGNVGYLEGDAATRERIAKDHVNYVQGLLYFLGNDSRVPQKLRDETNTWGLCKDEFTDNGHWPYALYVREGRRMISDYVMTQRDVQREIFKPDTVGMGSFVIDCHIVQRIVAEDGTVTDEGSFQDAPAKPYQIPYRSIVPKKAECDNLLVPVCLSASHIATCSLRMEPVYMALGQASGLSAAMAVKGNVAVQDVSVPALQAKLREQKAVLDLPNLVLGPASDQLAGVVVDDAHAEFTGSWVSSGYGAPVDDASHNDADSGKGEKTARFVAQLPAAGRYEVRFAYSSAPNRAASVPVEITHAGGVAKVWVDERKPGVHDKVFVSLGTFDFAANQPASVQVSNAWTRGFVSVDAVQWLPVK
ncbi:FAD-dependent oxidoreductase [Verrucomicrobium spinosum]|uniref:FAD-dependent oxidoreductase n=1 Tax=Verrucomicrobium spinosum TaxID=2736 RepID=UPI000174610E|nr:FAD-dependent oxidoreductase [Verrucomicrobium spinosum]